MKEQKGKAVNTRAPLIDHVVYSKVIADTIKLIRKIVVKCPTISYSTSNYDFF
ncbi:hypothetical protein GPUN_2593 [Glaciecola punicea ACAM 611]|uniref:Uncharacterized protein n=1 Tax=Glaciecola punicea ACAM 611 TaxID=1121923 RepID=H5TEI1_9ALTE|nr:hypothetical protein GPUN_2593 [Glaciecola punicea ACAM 611]